MAEKNRILIVEDESIVALDIQLCLQNSGYAVVGIVDTGENAIEQTQRKSPDIVLMDIHLKGNMDGIEAAMRIRSQYHTPVIFLSAYADEETIKRAQLAEAFGFILKPFGDNNLRPSIETALYKHRLELALRESEERYRVLADTLPDAVFVTDMDMTIHFCNDQAVKMYNFDHQTELLGRNALDFLAPESREELLRRASYLQQNGSKGVVEFTLVRNRGEHFQGEITASLIKDKNGKPESYIAISRDITHRKNLEKQTRELIEQVQNLARRDSLTNLYNRRYFNELAEVEFSRSKRYNRPLAAFMLDLDHFKSINDSFGHQVGDHALQAVAAILLTHLRDVDFVGRIGGDEFLALLPETTSEEASHLAQRICHEIGHSPIIVDHLTFQISASFGVAGNQQSPLNLQVLVNWADKALYRVKRDGGNGVQVHDFA